MLYLALASDCERSFAADCYADQSIEHENAVRSAFQNLLADAGRKVGWTLIPELSLDANGQSIRRARLYLYAKLPMFADLRNPLPTRLDPFPKRT